MLSERHLNVTLEGQFLGSVHGIEPEQAGSCPIMLWDALLKDPSNHIHGIMEPRMDVLSKCCPRDLRSPICGAEQRTT